MPKTASKSAIELFVIQQVRNMREKEGMSQSELAFRLGVSDGFIGQVESAKYPAKYNLNHIDKLAEIFKCSPQDFMPSRPVNKS